MKGLFIIFGISLFVVSCKKKNDPEPEMTSAIAGVYRYTEIYPTGDKEEYTMEITKLSATTVRLYVTGFEVVDGNKFQYDPLEFQPVALSTETTFLHKQTFNLTSEHGRDDIVYELDGLLQGGGLLLKSKTWDTDDPEHPSFYEMLFLKD